LKRARGRDDRAMEELPRVLSREGAHRLGFTESRVRTRLRRGDWRRLAEGALLTRPEQPRREDWANAGLIVGGQTAVLSGWDALRHGNLVKADPVGPVLILRRGGRHRAMGPIVVRPSVRPLRPHLLSPFDPMLPQGSLAPVARAITDVAPWYRTLTPIRAIVTSAVQRGLVTPDDLARELEECARNGSGLLRRAVADLLGGAHSVAEAEAFEQLRGRPDIPPFEANAPIYDAAGHRIAVADAWWRGLRAVLEIDSREFHFGEPEWKRTMRRHNMLGRLGLSVAHYPPSVIRDRHSGWLDEVADWLAMRAVEVGERPA
jgi:hypothetical protein